MRYDTPVFFQRIEPGEYDAATGDYGKDTVKEFMKYANVTDGSSNEARGLIILVYGEIRQGSKVIRLQRHYDKAFDRIRIGSRIYVVDIQRILRSKQTFVVSEVRQNASPA